MINEEEESNGNQEEPTLRVSDPLLANRLLAAAHEAVAEGILRHVVTTGPGGLATSLFEMSSKIGKALPHYCIWFP